MKQIDLFSQYKAETGKNKSDINLELQVDDDGKISIDKEYLNDSDLENIGMTTRFIRAVNKRFSIEETLTITDPEYIQWLESKLL